jgi:hypothetical protein
MEMARLADISCVRPIVLAMTLCLLAGASGAELCAREARSAPAVREFKRRTGYPQGRPGYEVDHILPLACGGADRPENMQWLTAAEHRAKTRRDRAGCIREQARKKPGAPDMTQREQSRPSSAH